MKILILALFVLLAGATSAQDCKALIPYSEGSTWQITNYSAKGKEVGKTNYELLEKTTSGSSVEFTIKTVSFDNKDNEVYTNSFNAWCKDGKFEFDMQQMINGASMGAYNDMDIEVDATTLEMPSMNTPAGTKLNDGSLSMQIKKGETNLFKMTIDITDRVMEAHEDVETTAGSFKCLKISQQVSTKMMMRITTKSTEWYADGVGMVASETYNKKGKLTGYSKLTQLSMK